LKCLLAKQSQSFQNKFIVSMPSPFGKFSFATFVSVKLLIVLLLAFSLALPGQSDVSGWPALRGGDTFSYFDPIENWLHHGHYAADLNRPETYAGRMPGYGVVYGAFRLTGLGVRAAESAMVGIQVVLTVLATWLLLKIVELIFADRRLTWIVAGVLAISTYNAVYDLTLLTESLATSLFIAALYCLLQARQSMPYLLLAGFLLTWTVFLRPFMLAFFGLFALYLVLDKWRRATLGLAFWPIIGGVVLLGLPFLVADGLWIARNYQIYQRPVPLQINTLAGYDIPASDPALRYFIGSWGGETTFWEPAAAARWYTLTDDKDEPGSPFPAYAYAPHYPLDSLRTFRRLFQLASDPQQPKAVRQQVDQCLLPRIEAMTADYRQAHLMRYYLLSPLQLCYKFLFHNGAYNISRVPFAEASLVGKLVRSAYALLFLVIIVLGLLGGTLVMLRRQLRPMLFVLPPTFIILLFPIVIRSVEYRYLVMAYPFMVVLAGYAVLWGWDRLRQYRAASAVSV
jgi:hypothetical protein